MKTRILIVSLMVFAFALAGCDLKGDVEQGRAVAFESGKSVTLVLDKIRDAKGKKGDYTGDIVTYKLPLEKKDMGADPATGCLLKIDADNSTVYVYDKNEKKVRALKVTVKDKDNTIDSRRHPKVAGKKFPEIKDGNVTVYAPSQKLLITFTPSQEDMELGDDTWKYGDEVRVAFMKADKTQLIRLMNVTKTDIFKR
ncbi:MAG: DUF4881 domain-containing protein [Desulfovibrio sp.]|jgi:hypothetical protein|nr:DUF4881 domain-containing protein [Desulfovibrio sp.]